MVTTEVADGQWLPLAEAAVVLHCSPDTVRRRVKDDKIPWRAEGNKYLVHVPNSRIAAHQPRPVIEELHPSVKAILDYLRERDAQRDKEVGQLREDLARARADLAAAQAMLPPAGKRWSPFEWIRQLWASQS